MKLSLEEILECTQGKLITNSMLSEKIAISTDTRKINPDDIFLPLKGENFDGHNFIDKAVNSGCKGYFAEQTRLSGISADIIISVNDTLEAYLNIAHYVRRKINPKIIGVTGSSGKTTTKELIYSVLATTFNTHKSILNHNNEIGLCQTLLSMPENTEYAVIEMGMRGLGEIELLSKYSEPDIAVITNIGSSHIGRLGSIENIAKAKCEITSSLKKNGVLIASNNKLVKKYCKWDGKTVFIENKQEITEREEDYTKFIYKEEEYQIPAIGEFNVINAVTAIETGLLAGIGHETIKKGLLTYSPVDNRGKTIDLKNGVKLIVDCYNANPDSVMASVKSIINVYKDSPIILVLGDMAELGEHEDELHKKVGTFISELSVHTLVTVGEKAYLTGQAAKNIRVKSFANNSEAADFLLRNIEENSVLFFKASRCMKLEEISDMIQNKF